MSKESTTEVIISDFGDGDSLAENSLTTEAEVAPRVKTEAKVIRPLGRPGLPPVLGGGGGGLAPVLIPCEPPVGAKLVPCQPPPHLRVQYKPPAPATYFLDMEAVSVPQEDFINVKPLSMTSVESEDQDMALVRKVGTGMKSTREEPRVTNFNMINNNSGSLQIVSVSSSNMGTTVGTGPKILQFFYQNPVDGIKIGFPPVRVTTSEELECVMALIEEKAEVFNRRNYPDLKWKPVKYTTLSVQARSILRQDIISHIEKCFTKKGMKDMVPGRKKKAYPKRSQIIKVPSIKQDNKDIKEEQKEYFESDDEREMEVDKVHDLPEYILPTSPDIDEGIDLEYERFSGLPPKVNTESEGNKIRNLDEVYDLPDEPINEYVLPTKHNVDEGLEYEMFSGQLPKVKIKSKGKKLLNRERKGRGGRNEVINQDNLFLGVVDQLLDKTKNSVKEEGTLDLKSLFKQRGQRKKKNQDVVDFADEDDYIPPKYAVNSSISGLRKSKRLKRGGEEE